MYYNTRSSLSGPYLRPHRILAAKLRRCRPPDFLIIGTVRGGTTSLYNYLTECPGVIGALIKEIHFFDFKYQRGWTWYLSHFPIQSSRAFLTGEATPNYMLYPEVMQRIIETLPNTKLIVLLRNPIERAYSHYHHIVELGFGDASESFEEALDHECDRKRNPWQLRDLSRRGFVESDYYYTLLSRGIYVAQLKPWMQKDTRSRFLILKSEDFFNDPGKTLSEVLHFLGLPATNRSAFRKYNEAHYEPMPDALRSSLREFYRPYNDELSRLLDMEFEEWT